MVNISSDRHPKDGFTGAAAHQDNASSMLGRDALSEGEPQARAFLLSFTEKCLEQAVSYPSWHPVPIVDPLYHNVGFEGTNPYQNSRNYARLPRRLTRVQDEVVHRPLNLLGIHNSATFVSVNVLNCQPNACGVRMRMDHSYCPVNESSYGLISPPDSRARATENQKRLN